MRQKISLILIYTASCLIAIGGLGDQFISSLLDVHMTFLGDPLPSPLLERAEALIMLMLHVVGGGLFILFAGDYRIAAETSTFCHGNLPRGVSPEALLSTSCRNELGEKDVKRRES